MRRALAAAALALAAPAAADTVLITADRMVDVIAGRMVERPAILVRDGVIVSVGTQGAAAPAADRTLSLPGLTLVPGLIDMHVHLTNVATIGGYNRFDPAVRASGPDPDRRTYASFLTRCASRAWNR